MKQSNALLEFEIKICLLFVTLLSLLFSLSSTASALTDPVSNGSKEYDLNAIDLDSRDGLVKLRDLVRDFTLAHYESSFPNSLVTANLTKDLPSFAGRKCAQPIELTAPRYLNRSGTALVSMHCHTEDSWRVYIPVSVNVSQEVLIAVGPIARNAEVDASNTSKRLVNLDSFRDQYVTSIEQLQGMVALRNIRNGQVIRTDLLTEPVLIKRGDRVMIQALAGDSSVKMLGTALAMGKRGDQIRVRNGSSDRIIVGQVTARGRVLVRM